MSIRNTQRVLSFPLVFPNKFLSIGINPRAGLHPITAPMDNEGLTSVERQEQALRAARFEQLNNAGIKLRNWDGTIQIPSFGDNSFTTNLLPSGVQSVEARDKQISAKRMIEMQNAGILSEKQRQLQTLADLSNKQKQYEQHKKLIEFLALREDEDFVPAEFQEEVEAYYAAHPGKKAEVDQLRAAYKQRMKRMKEAYGQPDKTPSSGRGIIHPVGWRARRLHELVRPFKRREVLPTPEEQTEQQKTEIDERQKMYRDQQTEERGVAPPSEMVKRAMPDTAEPVMLPIANIKNVMLVPHQFLFPKRRYMLSKVRK